MANGVDILSAILHLCDCNLVNIMQAWHLPPWTAGEYVFDHSWANSCARLTSTRYYPKLQSCVPFTPATGARILLAPGPNVAAVRRALATTLKTITGEAGR